MFDGLHCAYPDAPLTSEDFEARAVAAGIPNMNWMVFGDIDPDTGSVDTTEHDEQPGGFVTGAQMRNADTMAVFVDADNRSPAATTINMSNGTHDRTSPGCTPELAARWS